MRVFSKAILAGLLAAGAAGLAVTPAAANRCGHGYPVDHPTTLVEVAQRCNVNLSELYEANPGVDPRNVRPGEHLALPDERRANETYYAQGTGETASDVAETNDSRPTSAHPFIANYDGPVTDDYGLRNVYEVDEYLRDDEVRTHRIRVRDAKVRRNFSDADSMRNEGLLRRTGYSDLYYLRDASGHGDYSVEEVSLIRYTGYDREGNGELIWVNRTPPVMGANGLGYYDRLSYQERSKIRLAAAANGVYFADQVRGQTSAPPIYEGASKQRRPVTVSGARPVGVVECPTINGIDNKNGLHEVSKILSAPGKTFVEIRETLSGGQDCVFYKVGTGYGAPLRSSDVAGEPGVPLARFTYGPSIAPRSAYAPIGIVHASSANFALEGDIVAVSDGCLMMRTTADNQLWLLAAAPPSGDLLGKHVTVWGSTAATGTCGAGPTMLVNHAVYAEPWKGK